MRTVVTVTALLIYNYYNTTPGAEPKRARFNTFIIKIYSDAVHAGNACARCEIVGEREK